MAASPSGLALTIARNPRLGACALLGTPSVGAAGMPGHTADEWRASVAEAVAAAETTAREVAAAAQAAAEAQAHAAAERAEEARLAAEEELRLSMAAEEQVRDGFPCCAWGWLPNDPHPPSPLVADTHVPNFKMV